MNPKLMATGGFLLVLGITLIAAAPEIFLVYGQSAGNENYTAMMALFGIVFAPLGGGALAYGTGAK